MVTEVEIGVDGMVTLQAPFSTGMARLADILFAGNNALVVSGVGATHPVLMGMGNMECMNADKGNGTDYWIYSANINFTQDFYFSVGSYVPTIVYTLNCISNCY